MTDTVILDYSREVQLLQNAILAGQREIADLDADTFIKAAMNQMLSSVGEYVRDVSHDDDACTMEGTRQLVPLSRARLAGISHLVHRYGQRNPEIGRLASNVARRIMIPGTAAEEDSQKMADRQGEEWRKNGTWDD